MKNCLHTKAVYGGGRRRCSDCGMALGPLGSPEVEPGLWPQVENSVHTDKHEEALHEILQHAQNLSKENWLLRSEVSDLSTRVGQLTVVVGLLLCAMAVFVGVALR